MEAFCIATEASLITKLRNVGCVGNQRWLIPLSACYSHSCRVSFPNMGRALIELKVLQTVLNGEQASVGSDESGLEQREPW